MILEIEDTRGLLDGQARALMQRCADAAAAAEGVEEKTAVFVSIVGDEEIREINRSQRGKDMSTDVLSFPSGELDDYDEEMGIPCFLGDIALSPEFAKRQCEERDGEEASLLREITLLTVHSVLHLLGYDHELSEADDRDMRRRQNEIMNILKITRD